jgi:hypothetical protein
MEQFLLYEPLGGQPVIEVVAVLLTLLLVQLIRFASDPLIEFLITEGESWRRRVCWGCFLPFLSSHALLLLSSRLSSLCSSLLNFVLPQEEVPPKREQEVRPYCRVPSRVDTVYTFLFSRKIEGRVHKNGNELGQQRGICRHCYCWEDLYHSGERGGRMQLKVILVPYDFSEYADHAFRWALEIAEDWGAKIALVHVISLASCVSYPDAMFLLDLPKLEAQLIADAEQRLSAFVARRPASQ